MIDFLTHYAGMVGLIFFVSVFIGVVIWALLPQQKQLLESYRFLPFQEDKNGE
jgi:cbb3-type cytochrome oxidase subunit 3